MTGMGTRRKGAVETRGWLRRKKGEEIAKRVMVGEILSQP
jgi:hypothetical protein